MPRLTYSRLVSPKECLTNDCVCYFRLVGCYSRLVGYYVGGTLILEAALKWNVKETFFFNIKTWKMHTIVCNAGELYFVAFFAANSWHLSHMIIWEKYFVVYLEIDMLQIFWFCYFLHFKRSNCKSLKNGLKSKMWTSCYQSVLLISCQ